MVIGSCQLDIHIPGSHSLKEKRQVIKRIVSQVRNRYNVSISEIGNTDLWQRTQLGLVAVSRDKVIVESIFAKVLRFIESHSEVEILDDMTEYL